MILFTLYLCVLVSETRPFHMPDRLIKYLLQQLCSTEAAGLQEVLHFCAWAHLAITPDLKCDRVQLNRARDCFFI